MASIERETQAGQIETERSPRRARHLLVTNDFPPKVGGIQSYLWELWRRLDPESFVVLTANSDSRAREFDAAQAQRGFDIVRVSGRTLFFPTPSTRRRVVDIASSRDVSLVVLDPALPLGLLGPRLGLPYAVVLHGAEVAAPGRLPVLKSALGKVLRGASLVVSAGGYPASEGERAAGVRLPAVVNIPPGVDCDRIVPLDDRARVEARHSLGIPVDGLVVAAVSRLVPRKGIDVLVEAAARLRPSFPDLVVVVGGTGRQAETLRRSVERSGAPVRLLGSITDEDKAKLLGAADVFAAPCRDRWLGLEQEGFGIVFLEAAAAGVPQIAGDSGGAAEAVEDGETGLVVNRPQDAAEVAAALRRLLVDRTLRRRMGVAARRRAEASFDYRLLAPRLASALNQVQR